MIIPVRCFTCNALTKIREYEAIRLETGSEKAAFEQLGINRYCCRRMLLCNPVGLTDILMQQTVQNMRDESSGSCFIVEMKNKRVQDCL